MIAEVSIPVKSINLDDQSYKEIVRAAVARIPWLCPEWTDHNAHDPGITLTELFAWYTEAAQYHLNTVTEEIRLALLALCGVKPEGERAAVCSVRLPDGYYPALCSFRSEQDVNFELESEQEIGLNSIAAMYIEAGEQRSDVTEVLSDDLIIIPPFRYGGAEKSTLLIGFDRLNSGGKLILSVFAAEDYPVARNPFGNSGYRPRIISYELAGRGKIIPEYDETHDMSVSGDICFILPDDIPMTDGGCGLSQRYYLRIEQTYAGCGEDARLESICCGKRQLVQRTTLAYSQTLTAKRAFGKVRFALRDALSLEGDTVVFIKDGEYYRQADIISQERSERQKTIELDTAEEKAELLCVSLHPLYGHSLIFDSDGMPAMRLRTEFGDGVPIRRAMTLLCDTVCPDGEIRIALWRYTDKLSSALPDDRVFTYENGCVVFGDGGHGAMVPRGENAVLIASAATSLCGGGNVPADMGLYREGEGDGSGVRISNSAGKGGRAAENSITAAARISRMLADSDKCAGVRDYERIARETPGLRIARIKAIPCYDPDDPAPSRRCSVMTIAAAPYSSEPKPFADAAFLDEIRRHMEKYRTICTQIKVTPIRYANVSVRINASLTAGNAADRADAPNPELVKCVHNYFASLGIGETARRDVLYSDIAELKTVKRLDFVDIASEDTLSRVCSPGALEPMPDTVFYPSSITVISV